MPRDLRSPGDQVWFYNAKEQKLQHGEIRQVFRTYLESEKEEDKVTDSKYYVQVGEAHLTGVEEYELFDTKAQFIQKIIED